jgi:hypothetical protein
MLVDTDECCPNGHRAIGPNKSTCCNAGSAAQRDINTRLPITPDARAAGLS